MNQSQQLDKTDLAIQGLLARIQALEAQQVQGDTSESWMPRWVDMIEKDMQTLRRQVDQIRMQLADPESAQPRLASLTARQRRVFDLTVAGNTDEAIAKKMDISLGTVRGHARRMRRKLGLSSKEMILDWWTQVNFIAGEEAD